MEFNWIGLVSIIFVSTFLSIAIYVAINLKIRNKEMFQLLVQSEIDKKSLVNFIDKNKLEEEAGDGFVKFLSESREAAFKYIEEVQLALHNFSKTFETIALNVELEEGPTVTQADLRIATEAYRNLMLQLPKENDV